MGYISAAEAARRWGVSQRYVQKYCVEGRVPGAKKFSGAWAVPEEAQKPGDFRNPRAKAKALRERPGVVPMPLTNITFFPGSARETIDAMGSFEEKDLALAEYRYLSGSAGEALSMMEPYLDHPELSVRVPACLIYGFAGLAANRTEKTYRAMEILEAAFQDLDGDTPRDQEALVVFACCSIYTMLHLPRPRELPEMQEYICRLPMGVRLLALYVQARYAYINGKYGTAIGIGETALVLEGEPYPIPEIYLHLICAMGLIRTRNLQQAKQHFQKAWEIARADRLFQPFAEMYAFLGGMLELVPKREAPEDFRRIIAMVNIYIPGWCGIHNALSGEKIPASLTPNEFTIAALASRNWTNRQISQHLGISESTVKTAVSAALRKLEITQRKDLERFMP